MKLKILYLLLLLSTLESNVLASANALRLGLMPEVSISYTALDKVKLSFEYSSQEVFIDKGHLESSSLDYVHYRTDLRGNISYLINDSWSVVSGYQFRLLFDKSIVHRAIFQMSYQQEQKGKLILNHRLRSDPTFYKNEANKFRLRYRFGIEIPFSCKLEKEAKSYFFISDEPVYTLQAKMSYLENRVFVAYGYNFNAQQKIQAGLEHRLAEIERANNRLSHQLWLKLEWVLSF